MCGRFTHRFTWSQLHRLLSLTSPPIELPFRFNVAPTQLAPVVQADASAPASRILGFLRWGFPAPRAGASAGGVLINARAETVASRPTFRTAFRARRCIVPVSGFYEWTDAAPGARRPLYITPRTPSAGRDGAEETGILLLGGLWEPLTTPIGAASTSPNGAASSPPLGAASTSPIGAASTSPIGAASTSPIGAAGVFCIITTPPNAFMGAIHDRMPLVLGLSDVPCWLDPASPHDRVSSLLRPAAEDALHAHPVSPRVNSPRNDDNLLIQPIDPQADRETLFG